MYFNSVKSLLAVIIVSSSCSIAFADNSIPATAGTSPASTAPATPTPANTSAPATSVTTPESFQAICLNAWMGRATTVKDKIDYQNFGEKYCGCASVQPLDNAAAVDKAIQVCMSRTLLHDAMDALEEDVGLADSTSTDIDEYCLDRWNLVYPKMSASEKTAATSYCACANPKLLALIKSADNMTDKQYAEKVDDVASACSGNIRPDEATKNVVH